MVTGGFVPNLSYFLQFIRTPWPPADVPSACLGRRRRSGDLVHALWGAYFGQGSGSSASLREPHNIARLPEQAPERRLGGLPG